ncbi:FAD-dependent pyridine nucleotide-disulfide oxidoreductase [Clostridium sp. DL-VIII]|uniref:NAD(P)/FAD-dependent oxidoreductase n=1 Tax=Clostridium sp. DL-VIII TaxID=641107 RepID=UPI00023AF3D4|nr:NAD(P)/FAD-dependent oxidoreductase [Clostridium sp. DL-VIII]EHI97213.1 FAD-dependent pyridine nucleotide-disulfide oxidoreductase [Clostridium sp. DL-VIII]
MAIRINNINLGLDDELEVLEKKVCKRLNISNGNINKISIIKRSVDARKKNDIKFNYSVDVFCEKEKKILSKIHDKDIKLEEVKEIETIKSGTQKLNFRPVVVGFGPAGIFAALTLARQGYRPIVYERGEDVDKRTETVEKFWSTGELNLESNVQFGEGGAGTFSDGKLTTRIKDHRCVFVLDELIKAGAPVEIKYESKAHVGTDLLKGVVKNIREEIKNLGGEVNFNSKLERITYENGKLESIIVNGKEISCEALVLAIGHSSRDTYEMLYREKVSMDAKAFAIGVRIEHPQELINISQYGESHNHPKLQAADYRLTYQSERLGRGIYSFCMCPGGVVVAAASEEGRLVSNGMSYHARDLKNANSALVVTVSPEDFEGNSPLRGMEFQRYYENLAFKLGGGNYKAPVQLVGDFMKDRVSTGLGQVVPSYTAGYEFRELKNCLPDYVVEALKEGIANFDKKIKGYANEDAVLTGIETRTSAPVRLNRNEKLESINVCGLYPTGEGAGFAGGIISAAVDGIKVAEHIIQKFDVL